MSIKNIIVFSVRLVVVLMTADITCASKLIIRRGPHDSLTLRCCISVAQGFCQKQSWMTDLCAQFCFNDNCSRIVRRFGSSEDYDIKLVRKESKSLKRDGSTSVTWSEEVSGASSSSEEDQLPIRVFPTTALPITTNRRRVPAFVNSNPRRHRDFDESKEHSNNERVQISGGYYYQNGDGDSESRIEDEASNIESVTAMRWNGPQNMPMASNIDNLLPKDMHSICCRLVLKNGCFKDPIWMQTHCQLQCHKNVCQEQQQDDVTDQGVTKINYEKNDQALTDKWGDVPDDMKVKPNTSDVHELRSEIQRLQRERLLLIKLLKNSPLQNTTRSTLVPIHSVPDPFSESITENAQYYDDSQYDYDNNIEEVQQETIWYANDENYEEQDKDQSEYVPYVVFHTTTATTSTTTEAPETTTRPPSFIYSHVQTSARFADYIEDTVTDDYDKQTQRDNSQSGLSSCLHWMNEHSSYSFDCPSGTVSCGAFVHNGQPTVTPNLEDVCLKRGAESMGNGCKCSAQSCFCWCDHKNDCNHKQELVYKYELCASTEQSYRNLYKEIGWIDCVM